MKIKSKYINMEDRPFGAAAFGVLLATLREEEIDIRETFQPVIPKKKMEQ